MLEVSEKYREMAESDAREVSVKVNIGDIELTNDDIIELNIYRSMGESGFNIGGVVTTRIRLLALMKLPYSGEVAMDASVSFGFDEENASEYVQLGRFYGCATNPSFDTTQVEIVGYDKLGSGSFLNRRFHGDFAPEFPCSLQDILDYICQHSNIECDFTCNNYSVSELPLKDKTRDAADYERYYTYKEMLGFVAAAHGAVAAMDSNNKLVFLSIGEETETVDSADCIDFAFKSAEEFTVKGILLHVQDVLSTGSTNIFINDDSQIAYDGETTDGIVEASCPFGSIAMAEELWQQLGGFSYYSCEFTRRGRGWTELGDVIYANDSLSRRTLLKHEGKMIAQTVEWNFSAAEGFMEHIISKAESPEESTDRLGSGNAINNSKEGASENVEKIKFVKNNVEYGAVGIHNVDGKTGIALSMSKASEWIGLLDSDGNKILEYEPKKEATLNLYYYPIQSKNHPNFNKIYFAFPQIDNSKTNNKIFTSANELIDFDNEMKLCKDCTIFCDGQAITEWYKDKGFRKAVNAKDFIGDTWIMNGYELNVEWNPTSSAILARLSNNDSCIIAVFNGLNKLDAQSMKVIVENQKNVGSMISMVRQGDVSFKVLNGGFNPLSASSNNAFWNGVLPGKNGSPVIKVFDYYDQIKVYKNIVLMNGAKILNEDGTEYNIEGEVTP